MIGSLALTGTRFTLPVDGARPIDSGAAPSAPPPMPPLMQPPAAPMLPMRPIFATPPALMPITPLTVPPSLITPLIPRIPPFLPPITVPTRPAATQLAKGAITQLTNADTPSIQEAINALKSRNLTGDAVIAYLERKVRIGEVLGSLAADWAATTKTDFADAFQMLPDRLPVMDNIVSIAILNDRDLEAEIRAENTQPTTPNDLLQNRKIVWQYPDPGTVLQPPYVILIAVDYQEVATADQVVQSIMSQLGPYQGFQLPKSVVTRLTG
jgi:hypothetical protein